MRRGEIARAAGCTVGMLRHYEAVGLLPEPARTSGGQRLYGEEHRQILAFVLEARAAGLTLDDIRDLLALAAEGGHRCATVDQRLRRRQEALRAEIARLQDAERRLAALLSTCAEIPPEAHCPHLLTLLRPAPSPDAPPRVALPPDALPPRVAAGRPAGVGVPAGPARPVGRVAQR